MEKIMTGVFRLELPTPYKVGSTNSYIIVCDTCFDMIDVGPSVDGNLVIIEQALKELGLEISGLRRILMTHGHEDHGGLSYEVKRRSGAEILAGRKDIPIMRTNVRQSYLSDKANILSRFRRLGLPSGYLDSISPYFESRDYYKIAPDAISPLDGTEVFRVGDKDLKALATPGHTMGSICYFLEETGTLFSGDTIIGHLTPNPGAAIYHDILFTDRIDSNPLESFMGSLTKLKGMNVTSVHPGHGNAIDNPNDIIDGYLAHHKKRLDDILRALNGEPLSCFDLACRVFGEDSKIDNIILQLMEILAHLIYLEEKGEISRSRPTSDPDRWSHNS